MIKPIRSRQQVEEFMRLPEIYRYAAPPGANIEDPITTASNKEMWLGFYVDEVLSGVVGLHIETGSMAIFHPYILRRHKHLYADLVRMFFVWVKNNMQKELVKLNAYVPVVYEKTICIGKSVGMIEEGLDTLSYRHKNGVCDRVLLGIKLEDVGA